MSNESDDITETVFNDDSDKNKINLTVINTNAQSLCPKIHSLVDCMNDLSAAIGIITETWLTDGDSLQEDLENLTLGTGLKMLCRNREPNQQGFSHGGVGIIFSRRLWYR